MLFYMPTKIYEQKNAVINHASEIISFGSKPIIVTGKNSSRKNGSLNDILLILNKSDCPYVIFDDIEENPSVETVIKAASIGIDQEVDYVIGIGGGSPLDAAKAIALLLGEKTLNKEILYDATYKANPLPVVAIPTTCGTGSEVTGVSVLTVHEKRTKSSLPHRIFPKLALVDYKYLIDAPRNIIVNTAIDAMSHLVESYLVKTSSSYSDMIVNEGLLTWGKCIDALWNKRNFTEEDYMNLMHASTMGGMSIAHTGTAIPHSMSYSLTYELHIPHGIAVGYFLPGYIKASGEELSKKLMDMMGFASVNEFGTFYKDVSEAFDVSDEIIEMIVNQVASNLTKLSMCKFSLDKASLNEIAHYYR